MAAPQRSDSSANLLLNLVDGYRVTAVIYVAARLGIADLLLEGSKSVPELARLTDTHERSLLRLMRALVTLALCTEASDGTFKLTEMGTHLAANSERSLKAWVLFEGGLFRAVWGELIESIRTGKTAAELAGRGQEHFEAFAKTKHAGLFNEAMVSLTRMAVPDVLSAYDFSGISTLMDVGGGFGELMSVILKEYPSMRGIVFDLPHCAEGASKHLSDAGVADRCEFVAGSFFESVPAGADAIIMKSIIHDWNDERCELILRNCHAALKRGDRLTVVDRVVPEKLEPKADHLSAVLSDLNMLRGPGGCERTESEFRALMAKGGFGLRRVVPTGRYSVIEGAAA
jgi:hypothetical protein